MADTLTVNAYDSFELRFKRSVPGATLPDNIQAGSGAFPSLVKRLADNGPTELTKATLYYRALAYSFPASSTTDFDLSALTGQFTQPEPQIVRFTLVKHLRLRIQTPAAGQRLLLGNYGLLGWTGWLASITATHEVRDEVSEWNRIDGWAVNAGAKMLRVQNPGLAAVVADLILVGR